MSEKFFVKELFESKSIGGSDSLGIDEGMEGKQEKRDNILADEVKRM